MGRKTKRKFGYIKPAPPQPKALDHSAYPHVLDLVIGFAPPAALLALSQTCRALRARLTDALYAHVVVSEPSGVTLDPDDDDPLEPEGHNVLVTLPSGRRVLALDLPCVPNPDIPLDHALSRLLSRATVASFTAPIAPALVDAPYAPGRAKVVRLLGGSEYPRVMAPPGSLVAFHSVALASVAKAAPPAPLTVPRGVGRVVANYAFDGAWRGGAPGGVLALPDIPETVQKVVLIFSGRASTRPEPTGADALWKSYLLNAATGAMFPALARTRYLFVEAESLGSWVVDTVKEALAAYYDAVAEQEIATAPLYNDTGPDAAWKRDIRARCAAPLANARFLTREEYRAYVGAEQYALETEA
ncbi:hypothetical protein Q8F55_008659 [Vanrija albida]|uniref:F-box domain-containing protein n=1 Tax=Vanrija albida TaxID=181172 RepID=A0ABR3PRE2_9TREE